MTLSVALTTRAQPAANALINRLQDHFPLKKVIWERWSPRAELSVDRERLRRVLDHRARYYRGRLAARLADPLDREGERRRDALDRVYGQRHRAIERPPPSVEIDDRDWATAAELLAADPPDVLLVFGNSLIPESVTRLARVAALNIHTGLSPHYRGQNCTRFAILNDDLENIGVTVHVVRKQIDGGELIAQRRPEIVRGDDELSIDFKVQRLGHELYVEILERLERGESLRPVPQEKNSGLLLMARAETPGHVALVRELVEGGIVDRYLERKALGKLRSKAILDRIAMGP